LSDDISYYQAHCKQHPKDHKSYRYLFIHFS
jgi:ribosomal protein S15P/S13E